MERLSGGKLRGTNFPAFLSKDYEFVKELASSTTTVIYQAISTRGRLRGRNIVLKKVTRSETITTSASLHQALSHPNIVTLHCVVFSDSENFDYHVLEHCSEGSLNQYLHTRKPPTLGDTELRHVVKGVSAALCYLEKEAIVHGHLSSTCILIGQGFQPKISNFKYARRQDKNQGFDATSLATAVHAAPELKENPSFYDFSLDTWAFGCILYICTGGSPPVNPLLDVKRFRIGFINHSAQLCELVLGLLNQSPSERLKAHQILKHPFLSEHLTSVSHPLNSENGQETQVGEQETVTVEFEYKTPSTNAPVLQKRRPLLDIGNIALPQFLRAKYSSCSDTVVSRYPTEGKCTVVPEPNPPALDVLDKSQLDDDNKLPQKNARLESYQFDIGKLSPTLPVLPIGTVRPLPLDTSSLSPKIHRLASGSVTVLKSQSILVDFRHHQRRQGLKGDQVMLISSQGASIKIFDAPHLSIPSCLLEPIHHYDLECLPSAYWKQYNDVANFIGRLKRKIPRVVIYESGMKFSLMSNSPQADVEILLYDDENALSGANKLDNSSAGPQSKGQSATVRIQYSRQRQFVEFAERLVGDLGTEWRKLCKPCRCLDDVFALLLGNELSAESKKGLKMLLELLESCRYIEDPKAVGQEGTSVMGFPQGAFCSRRTGEYTSDVMAPSGDALLDNARFLPSVGWCQLFYASGTANGGAYMLMFLDGTSMLVNTTTDTVLFRSLVGHQIMCALSRHQTLQCHPEIQKYTRSISDFISLYDAQNM